MSRLFTQWLTLGVLFLTGPLFLFAADELSPEAPTTGKHGAAPAPAPAPAGDPFNGTEFQLNDYLKGTPEHIRVTLNGEVERLIGRIKETKSEIRHANKDCDTDIKTAQNQLHENAAFKQATIEKKQAEADLANARAGGSADDRVAASSRFNKARFALEKMEKDAIVNCKPLLEDQRRSYEMGHEIKRLEDGLDKAMKWRTQLLEATRNTFAMKMPVEIGAKGTLPRCDIETVIDGDHVLVAFEAWKVKGPGKEQEGLTSFAVDTKKVRILVGGVETKGLKQGDQKNFDRVFVIADKTADGGGTVFIANPQPSDADKLFDTIVPLRDSLPAAQVPSDKAD